MGIMQPLTLKKNTVSCGACVYRVDAGQIYVLLVKPFKTRDSWGVPKGHINENESIEDCAKREVWEEVGIQINLEEPLPIVSTSYRDEYKRVITFLATQTCDIEAYPMDGENAEVKWFRDDELPNLHVYQRALVLGAINVLRRRFHGN